MTIHQSSLEAALDQQQEHGVPASVLVLLCTYNEIGNLPKVVNLLTKQMPDADILVVDDNSPDGTGRWAAENAQQNSKLSVLCRAGKLGLGSATRDGIAWALARNYQYLINFDADLSHDPRDARTLLDVCLSAPARIDVSIGSRYVSGGKTLGLSWFRRQASKIFNLYAIKMLKLPIRDCSGSFRCYRISKLRELETTKMTCNGYGFLEEILFHLHRRGARFVEVPITYEHRLSGTSKLSLSDACGALLVIHRLAFG